MMENKCKLVCSRGLLKSCTFYSSNPKSSCNNDTSYLINMLSSNDKFDGMSIYVCSELLNFFVNKILPNITNKFILVSGDSDLCVPMEVLSQIETIKLLNFPLLIYWLAQNTRIQENDKIIQMPIGLDYHTINSNSNHMWKEKDEPHLPIFQESILFKVIEESPKFIDRKNKIYVKFTLGSDRFHDRIKSLQTIPRNLLEINNNFTKRTNTWQQMAKYKFILSPFGNGMDCHRTWESIALGCIPIIRSPNFRNLFNEFNVLIVNDWNEITEELLNSYLSSIGNNELNNINNEKLNLKYWVDKIQVEL
jgi:hypothetical protein